MSIFRVDVNPMAWFSLSFDSCWGKGLTVKLTGVYTYWDSTNFIGNLLNHFHSFQGILSVGMGMTLFTSKR